MFCFFIKKQHLAKSNIIHNLCFYSSVKKTINSILIWNICSLYHCTRNKLANKLALLEIRNWQLAWEFIIWYRY